MLNMVVLESPGDDWVLTANETRIYVTMPEVQKIAVVDTAGWEVLRSITLGQRPGRLTLPPDERVLWIAEDDANAEPARPSGITALDTDTMEPAARIVTGRGHHEMALSDDGRWLFATNERERTVSIIDTRSLTKVADLSIGSRPGSIAFSPLARMAYITSEDARSPSWMASGAASSRTSRPSRAWARSRSPPAGDWVSS